MPVAHPENRGLHLPCSGSLGPRFPTLPVRLFYLWPSVICSAKTSKCPSRVCSLFAIRPRYLVPPVFIVCVSACSGLIDGQDPPHQHRDFAIAGSPVTVFYTGKHSDLPSSQVTPVTACPGLRPRWCPGHIAITPPELLPSAGCMASAFLSRYIERLSS